MALDAVNGKIEGMANIQAFEQFSKNQVVQTLKNKYEEIGPYIANTTTFTKDDKKENAFKGNKRGLVVTVQEMGFKPGTFQNTSDPFKKFQSKSHVLFMHFEALRKHY